MPIYDYRCSACGHEVEVIHAIDGSGPAACAVCGGSMRKALSTPAIHFKGSGWAKKDAQTAARTTSADKKGEKDGKASAGDKDGTKPSEGSSTKASDSSADSTSKDGAAVSSGNAGSSD